MPSVAHLGDTSGSLRSWVASSEQERKAARSKNFGISLGRYYRSGVAAVSGATGPITL
jgi:hypothetical protein